MTDSLSALGKTQLPADHQWRTNRVGLCMIVRDEAQVIERCLASVRDHIQHWVVVDTGSTDGTQELVRELLAGIPGFLLERPWRDLGHNRSEALVAARPHAEYSLLIDADEVLVAPDGFDWPDLTADSIALMHRHHSLLHWRPSLVANRLPWAYRGALNEHPSAEGAAPGVRLPGPQVVAHFDGTHSNGINSTEKAAGHARVLDAALVEEPDNAGYQYRLAFKYRASDQPELALAAYRRRVEMGGNPEEVVDSLFWVAQLLERTAAAEEEVLAAHLRAWESRPTRAEPLVALAMYCRSRQKFALGRMVAAQAAAIPRPDDLLWIDEDVYNWRCLDEFAVSSYWTGDYADAADACRDLLDGGRLPVEHRARVTANLQFALEKLPPQAEATTASVIPRQIERDVPRASANPVSDGPDPLATLLRPARPTAVVDVGADPMGGELPYTSMRRAGLCTVLGFEPQTGSASRAHRGAGSHGAYLPYVVGDGHDHTLHVCRDERMSSLLRPEPASLEMFNLFTDLGSVVSTSTVTTRRLDDIAEVESLDLLKIDVRGSELSVIRGGREKLRAAVAIHTGVSLVNLYENQPTFGAIDAELRAQGFLPHTFDTIKRWPLAPVVVDGEPRQALNQLLEAEIVYVRDIRRATAMPSEQLKHLAMIGHHCYGSFDLAARCVLELERRGAVKAAATRDYGRLIEPHGISLGTEHAIA